MPPEIGSGLFFKISTVTTIVAGTMFLMWLGEQITQRGIGNGISLIIFSGIVAEIPRALVTTFELGRTGAISTLMIIFIFILLVLTILFIVFMERALRKILINYPKRQMGNKIYGGESSHLQLKINTAGVIPAIFASALLLLPITLSNFGFSNSETFLDISSMFSQGQPLYMILYASGIIFFSFFNVFISFILGTSFSQISLVYRQIDPPKVTSFSASKTKSVVHFFMIFFVLLLTFY